MPKKQIQPTPFDAGYYLLSYEQAKQGKADEEIAEALGVPWDDFEDWLLTKKRLREAVKEGRKKGRELQDLHQGLTYKQKRFADEYLKDFNGTAAIRRISPEGSYSRMEACRLLRIPTVAEYIKENVALEIMPPEAVLRETSRIARSDLRKAFDADGNLKPPSEWDDDTASVIASVDVASLRIMGDVESRVTKIKTWDKNKALDLLAKVHGLTTDRIEVSGPAGGPIVLQALAEIEKGEPPVIIDAEVVSNAARRMLADAPDED